MLVKISVDLPVKMNEVLEQIAAKRRLSKRLVIEKFLKLGSQIERNQDLSIQALDLMFPFEKPVVDKKIHKLLMFRDSSGNMVEE